jgi:diguanylate cyclase (GGDEF)-like protein
LRIQISFSKSTPIFIIIANDISERKIAEQKILDLNLSLEHRIKERTYEVSHSLALIKATLQSTTDAILVVNNEGELVEYNQKYLDFFENNNSPSMGINVLLSQVANPENFITKLTEISAHSLQKSFDELQLKNGRYIECHSQPQIVNGLITGRVWCLRDVTTQKNLQEQLIRKATHDTLTDIPNRLLLEDRARQAIFYANETKTLFALLFIDLDRFKNINDSLGHEMGDLVLTQVANRLKLAIRATDSVARLGGDEFVVLLSALKTTDEIATLAQAIQKEISQPYLIGNQTLVVSSSIGISVYPKDCNDVASLLRNADTAMYRSKEISNNTINFYTEQMNQQAKKRLELENCLLSALENNEILLNYQPLLDLNTGKIFGVEALIRWSHPLLGIVPPTEFIPIAESIGAIFSLGAWVMRTACKQLQQWHDLNFKHLRMAINVSPQQFKHPNFLASVKEILIETEVDATFLDFELTENLMLDDVDSVIDKMIELKELGISLVIDDFGTGYSSLNYLNKLPINKLKIDRSFLCTLENDDRGAAIVLAIISLAKSLKIKVLAEGVETQQQLKFLRNNYCDEIQGYFFSKPLAANVCEKFFIDHIKNPFGV